MDLATMNPILRLGIFGGLFLSLTAVAAWLILAEEAQRSLVHALIAGTGVVLSLPALVVSLLSLDGERGVALLPATGVLALFGFLTTAAAVGHYLRRATEEGTVTTSVGTGAHPGGTRLGFAGAAVGAAPGGAGATRIEGVSTPTRLDVPDPGAAAGATRLDSRPTPGAGGLPTRLDTPAGATRLAPPPKPAPTDQTIISGPPTGLAGHLAYLIDHSGDGRAHRLGENTAIGRAAARGSGAVVSGPGSISLEDGEMSREHARIRYEDGRFVLYDLGSTNGTQLTRGGRKRRVQTPTPLEDGDAILMGRTQFVYFEVPPS